MIKRPMLASSEAIIVKADGRAHHPEDWDIVRKLLPMSASVKLDGIRCLHLPSYGVCSREFKHIPNHHISQAISRECPMHLDGEIITYDTGIMLEFNEIQSDVMSMAGKPEFLFHVFDSCLDPAAHFTRRQEYLQDLMARKELPDIVRLVPQQIVTTVEEIELLCEQSFADGYEGLILRYPWAPYKQGRATLKQGWSIKVKHFLDAEGTVIGFEERMKNNNPKTKNNLGHSVRSSHKAGKVPMNTLGKLILDTEYGILKVGTGRGLNDKFRKYIWDHKAEFMGKKVTYMFQPHGMKKLPRLPIFKGFRKEFDNAGI